MFVVEKDADGMGSLPAMEVTPVQARAMSSVLAQRILAALAKEDGYPKALARKLRVHEQRIYYHINRLHEAKVIVPSRKEYVQGANAVYYALAKPAFVIKLRGFDKAHKILTGADAGILAPFVKDGSFDGIVVTGSPDPHGPSMARSRDSVHAMDLVMFFGSFLSHARELVMRVDTEVTEEELRQNLIVIGGPIVNALTARLNSRLPIRFDGETNHAIRSSLSGKTYTSESVGMVVRVANPWNPLKYVLVVAGTRGAGTRAVVLAFLKHFDELSAGNSTDPRVLARVVEGVDRDANGVVDDAVMVE